MSYFSKHKDFFKEHLARLIATIVLFGMGWTALYAWQWLVAFLK